MKTTRQDRSSRWQLKWCALQLAFTSSSASSNSNYSRINNSQLRKRSAVNYSRTWIQANCTEPWCSMSTVTTSKLSTRIRIWLFQCSRRSTMRRYSPYYKNSRCSKRRRCKRSSSFKAEERNLRTNWCPSLRSTRQSRRGKLSAFWRRSR